jgi:hypothetical protein
MEDVNIGYKLQHLIPAFFIIVAGALLFFASWVLAVPVILLGISLLCMRAGIEIDTKNKAIRKYSAWGTVKFGSWISLQPYNHVEIRYTSESQSMHSRGSSVTVRTKTYDLVFFDGKGTEFEFNDFIDYEIGHRVFKIVVASFGMTSRNVIAEMVQKAKERKRH